MGDDDNINFNISEICRLCLTHEEDMLPIFDNKAGGQAPPLPVKIMTCASVKVVVGDGLPELICHQCAVHVDSWYRFKKQCQKSDATLRRYIIRQQSDSANDSEEETIRRGLRTRRKQTNPNTRRQAIVAAKEAAAIERERSAEARIFANDVAEHVVEEVPVYPDLPCEVKVEGGDDERTGRLDESQAEENSEFLPTLPINKGFPCEVCHRSFSSKSYLRDHHAVHSGERSFACLVCGKAFYSDRKLALHVKTHSVERPCLCSVCGKAFREKSDLKKHFRLHSDESPFLCNVCGKTFKTKFYLTRHLMIHSGEKRHTCAECGKAFTWRDTLMAHAKVHARERPLACSVCSKGFKRKEDLVRHMRIHTGEKPFVCPYCERPFSDKWNLTQHLRLHTGQKPYVCSVCNLAFTHNVTLRNHMKQHQTLV